MTPSIIKGKILEIRSAVTGENKPALVVDDPNMTDAVVVPITNWLLHNLPQLKVGDAVIITALCDADFRIMDAMTLLYDAPPK